MITDVKDYLKTAHKIVQFVGGKQNIVSIERTVSGLNIVIENHFLINEQSVIHLPEVLDIIVKERLIEIHLTHHVDLIYDEIDKIINSIKITKTTHNTSKSLIISDFFAAIFSPFLHILIAAGMLNICWSLINLWWPDFESTEYNRILYNIAHAPFWFISLLITLTLAKYLRCNVYVTVSCHLVLLGIQWYQIDNGEYQQFTFQTLIDLFVNGSVLPALLIVCLVFLLERLVNLKRSAFVRSILISLISMIMVVPLAIFPLGLRMIKLNVLIVNLHEEYMNQSSIIIGGFFSLIYEVLKILGLERSLLPLVIHDVVSLTQNRLQISMMIAIIAQVAAAISFAMKTKNCHLRWLSLCTAIIALFGITIPAIFAINLRFIKPFIFGCISAAIGGMTVAMFDAYCLSYFPNLNLLSLINMINETNSQSIVGIICGCLIALIMPIILTLLFGNGEPKTMRRFTEKS